MTVNKPMPQSPTEEPVLELRSLKDLEGYKVSAQDGNIGKVYDFLFDNELWILRYVVVDTGNWLPGRKVLLTPGVLLNLNWRDRTVSVALTRQQIESSPDIDTDRPVERQREMELHSHYGWPVYWAGADAVGTMTPITPMTLPPPTPSPEPKADPHLHSVRAVTGYAVEATDGDIGKVLDFIADAEAWTVRYLVIATHQWLPGREVLISPQWLVGPISWSEQKVKVIMSRESIKNSPEYDPRTPVNREYEGRLYDFYGRPNYWS